MLADSRRRTLELVSDLTDEQMKVPLLSIINPPVWEMGHVAWFQEKWALRHLHGESPVRDYGDAVWDSAAVPHDDRWEPPSRSETLRYMQEVLDRVSGRLPQGEVSENEAYFHWLAIMHEDMHGEAFTYMRQTLEYPVPELSIAKEESSVRKIGGGSLPGDVEVPGGVFQLGATPDLPFVFDNEKWAHPVEIARFKIAKAPVTNSEFAEFITDRGYLRRDLWSPQGWVWRTKTGAQHPLYWYRGQGGWLRRHFDRLVPLEAHAPVIHVNWYEAEAYCQWADRRLPTEAEWEMAAGAEPTPDGTDITDRKRRYPWGDEPPAPEHANLDSRMLGCVDVGAFAAGDSAFGCRQMIGNIWEWTASSFRSEERRVGKECRL